MKKIISIFIISLLSSIAVQAGSGSKSDAIYEELSKYDQVFSLSFNKEMLNSIDTEFDFNGKERYLSGDFHRGRMLVANNGATAASVLRKFKRMNYKQIEINEAFEKELDEGEEPDNIYLMVEKDGKYVKEAHFVVDNDDGIVLFSFYGKIEVKNKK